jgi:hypothetical protein
MKRFPLPGSNEPLGTNTARSTLTEVFNLFFKLHIRTTHPHLATARELSALIEEGPTALFRFVSPLFLFLCSLRQKTLEQCHPTR